MTNKNKTTMTGWECPKCGRIYALWVKSCDFCAKFIGECVNDSSTSGTWRKERR